MKKMVVLNETPRRTSKSFGINNIKIENFELPELKDFSNVNIETEVNIENTVHEFKPKFSIGEVLVNQIKDQANKKLYINIDKDIKKPIVIEIPFEEYKELLIIKGRYEELKSQQNIPWTVKPNGTTITYTNTREQDKELTPPYKVTC